MKPFVQIQYMLCAAVAAVLAGCSAASSGSQMAPSGNEIIARRSSSPTYTTLLRFAPKGCCQEFPVGSLAEVDGTLYGTTVGRDSRVGPMDGTVYRLATDGAIKRLHKFTGNPDAVSPNGALLNVNGTLYGTSEFGGSAGAGTVYSITPSGIETVLHSFAGGSDGANPVAGLANMDGTLYGTTAYGGGGACSTPANSALGCGTVFSITTRGVEKTLYRFKTWNDGAFPEGSLVAVGGMLYGTTLFGGGGTGNGEVFRITAAGARKIIYAFTDATSGAPDGSDPTGTLADVNGILYGTTLYGGTDALGTVYRLSRSGSESVLYSFDGANGARPSGVSYFGGGLYGTTQQGGTTGNGYFCTNGCGTVYSLSLSGQENVLHYFTGGTDGAGPLDKALVEVHHTLYGSTHSGGDTRCRGLGCGTVFAITP